VANAVRLQLHALAYKLGTFLRTLGLPEGVERWTLTTWRKKLVKIGAKMVSHGRYAASQIAEVAVPRRLFAGGAVAHRSAAGAAGAGVRAGRVGLGRQQMEEVCLSGRPTEPAICQASGHWRRPRPNWMAAQAQTGASYPLPHQASGECPP
jgi:Transposase DDE domain group 1